MRRFFIALAALLMAFPAYAGWNIRQNADGTADWINGFGETVPIGAVYLSAYITDIATAQTVAVVVPITASKVTLIQSVLDGTITTAATAVDFWRSIDGAGTVVDEITNAVSKMSIASESDIGTVDTFTPTSANTLQKGGVVFIHVDGSSTSTGQIGVRFLLTIQPSR